MFSDGVTILDAADPQKLKPVGFFTAGVNTRTHHLQVAEDLLLLANGANIVAMQSYDNLRGYFENALADSITNKKKFRSGLSIHDISKPGEMREIAFLEMPGFGINRLWWTGGRYAYVSAHFDGYTDHIMCIVDLQNITKPEIVSKWWLPGMNRAGGEPSTLAPGKRVALHHMIVAGDRGYGAWRDGGFTIHDISDRTKPKLLSRLNWSPPFPAAPTRRCRCPAAISRSSQTRPTRRSAQKACSIPSSWTSARRRTRCRSRRCPRRRDATSAGSERSARTTCTKTGPDRSRARKRCLRPTTSPAYACSTSATRSRQGNRVVDTANAEEVSRSAPEHRPRREIRRHLRPRDGLIYLSDWNAGLNVLQYRDKKGFTVHGSRFKVHGSERGGWQCVAGCYSVS